MNTTKTPVSTISAASESKTNLIAVYVPIIVLILLICSLAFFLWKRNFRWIPSVFHSSRTSMENNTYQSTTAQKYLSQDTPDASSLGAFGAYNSSPVSFQATSVITHRHYENVTIGSPISTEQPCEQKSTQYTQSEAEFVQCGNPIEIYTQGDPAETNFFTCSQPDDDPIYGNEGCSIYCNYQYPAVAADADEVDDGRKEDDIYIFPDQNEPDIY